VIENKQKANLFTDQDEHGAGIVHWAVYLLYRKDIALGGRSENHHKPALQ